MSEPCSNKGRQPASALMTVPGAERAPNLEEAAPYLGGPGEALGRGFGGILFDPAERRYAVEVDARALENRVPDAARGPFSNPAIAPLSRPATEDGG